MALFSLIMGVRCSGAITGERERQTWEMLLLTPLDAKTLVRNKLWGTIDAARPYLLAYTVPVLALSILGGFAACLCTLFWWAVTWLMMYFMAAVGIHSSARAASSWRSLQSALMNAGRFIILDFFFIVLPWGTVLVVIPLSFILLAFFGFAQKAPSSIATWLAPVATMGGCFGTALLLFARAEILMQQAAMHLSKKERILQDGEYDYSGRTKAMQPRRTNARTAFWNVERNSFRSRHRTE
jgi:hypothetical protein